MNLLRKHTAKIIACIGLALFVGSAGVQNIDIIRIIGIIIGLKIFILATLFSYFPGKL